MRPLSARASGRPLPALAANCTVGREPHARAFAFRHGRPAKKNAAMLRVGPAVPSFSSGDRGCNQCIPVRPVGDALWYTQRGCLSSFGLDSFSHRLSARRSNSLKLLRRVVQKITDGLKRRNHVFLVVDLPFRGRGVPAAQNDGDRLEDPVPFDFHPLGE